MVIDSTLSFQIIASWSLYKCSLFYTLKHQTPLSKHLLSSPGRGWFFSFLLSIISFLGMLYFKYFLSISFIKTPLPTLTALFAIIGFQFILMGLLAEIFIRKNNSYQNKEDIVIKEEIINI